MSIEWSEEGEDTDAYFGAYEDELYAGEKRARDEDGGPPHAARRFRPTPFDPEHLPDAPPLRATTQPAPDGRAAPAARPAAAGRPAAAAAGRPAARPFGPSRPQEAERPAFQRRAAPAAAETAAPAPRPYRGTTTSNPAAYNVVDQLSNTAAKVSITTLLRNSPAYRQQVKEFLLGLERSDAAAKTDAARAHLHAAGGPAGGAPLHASPAARRAHHASIAAAAAGAPRPTATSTGNTSVVRTRANILDMPVSAIVDSGASHTVMSQSVARKLQLIPYLESTNSSFLTAAGSRERPWGILREMPIRVGKLTLPVDVHVTKATSYSILLGCDWLSQAGAVLDWDAKKLRFLVGPSEWDEVDIDYEGNLKLQFLDFGPSNPEADKKGRPEGLENQPSNRAAQADPVPAGQGCAPPADEQAPRAAAPAAGPAGLADQPGSPTSSLGSPTSECMMLDADQFLRQWARCGCGLEDHSLANPLWWIPDVGAKEVQLLDFGPSPPDEDLGAQGELEPVQNEPSPAQPQAVEPAPLPAPEPEQPEGPAEELVSPAASQSSLGPEPSLLDAEPDSPTSSEGVELVLAEFCRSLTMSGPEAASAPPVSPIPADSPPEPSPAPKKRRSQADCSPQPPPPAELAAAAMRLLSGRQLCCRPADASAAPGLLQPNLHPHATAASVPATQRRDEQAHEDGKHCCLMVTDFDGSSNCSFYTSWGTDQDDEPPDLVSDADSELGDIEDWPPASVASAEALAALSLDPARQAPGAGSAALPLSGPPPLPTATLQGSRLPPSFPPAPRPLGSLPLLHEELEEEEPPLAAGDVAERIDQMKFGSQLTPEQVDMIKAVLWDNRDVFSWSKYDLGCTHLATCDIDTSDHPPIAVRQYRLSPREKEQVEIEVQRLRQAGLIEPSKSPWNTPLLVVPKPAGGGVRVVADLRKLNQIIKVPQTPMPRVDDMLDRLGGAAFFTKCDLRSGFWQVPLNPAHRERTAFSSESGHWHYVRMPQGLASAPSVFQQLMTDCLAPHPRAFPYIDDTICGSSTFTQHLEDLDHMLGLIRQAGLKISADKSEFGCSELNFLGCKLTAAGHQPDPEKVRCIAECPRPTDLKGVRALLGVAGYYRRYVRGFAHIARPLTDLLKKDVPFNWGEEQEAAFLQLKQALISDPILRPPDFSRPFMLFTDWAPNCIGAILAQKDDDGNEYVVAYASRVLHGPETRYPPVEGELLALVWSLQHWRHLVYGQPLSIFTDHSCLRYLMTTTNLSGRLLRWSLVLQGYWIREINYRPGPTQHQNVDGLTRLPTGVAEPPPIEGAADPARAAATGPPQQAQPELLYWDNSRDGDRLGTALVESGGSDYGTDCPSPTHTATPAKFLPEMCIFMSNGCTDAARMEREEARPARAEAERSPEQSAASAPATEEILVEQAVNAQPQDPGPTVPLRATFAFRFNEPCFARREASERPPVKAHDVVIVHHLQSDGRIGRNAVGPLFVERVDEQRQQCVVSCREAVRYRVELSRVRPYPLSIKRSRPRGAPRQSSYNGPIPQDLACEICGSEEDEAYMVLCDNCDAGYHVWCLEPPLPGIPQGSWFCPCCSQPPTAYLPDDEAPRSQPAPTRRARETQRPQDQQRDGEAALPPPNIAGQQPTPQRRPAPAAAAPPDDSYLQIYTSELEEGQLAGQFSEALTNSGSEEPEPPQCSLPRPPTLDITKDTAVKHLLVTGTYPHGTDAASKSRIRKRAANYCLSGGQLCRKPTGRFPQRRVPEIQDRERLLSQAHDQLGHFGQRRTLHLLQQRYYWSGQSRDVQNFVRSCHVCQTENPEWPKSHELRSIAPGGRFNRCGLDLIGPLPRTASGNEYIITCVEYSTRFGAAAALPDKRSETIARWLANYISVFGCMSIVQTDQGSEFRGAFDELCQRALIDHRTASAYRPQTGGLVERYNGSLSRSLRRCVQEQPTTWDEHLPWVVLSYNAAAQGSTRFSPYKLLLSVDPLTPLDLVLPRDQTESAEDEPSDEEMQRREQRHAAELRQAGANLETAQARQQEQYRARRARKPYVLRLKEGEFVLVKHELPGGKFSKEADGPFRFLRYTDAECTVALLADKQERRWKCSAQRIKRYTVRKRSNPAGAATAAPTCDEADAGPVSAVAAERMNDGKAAASPSHTDYASVSEDGATLSQEPASLQTAEVDLISQDSAPPETPDGTLLPPPAEPPALRRQPRLSSKAQVERDAEQLRAVFRQAVQSQLPTPTARPRPGKKRPPQGNPQPAPKRRQLPLGGSPQDLP